MNAPYVPLRCYSHFSFLDALTRPEDLVAEAKKRGHTAIGLADSGGVYGLIDFHDAAKKAGIRPLMGMQVYVARYGRTQRRPGIDVRPYHLTLYAKNETGYKNLLRLATLSHTEGFYYRPRVDHELLEKYSEGLIALLGASFGEVGQLLLSGKTTEARDALLRYKAWYADGCYVEIQRHDAFEDDSTLTPLLIDMAKKEEVPLVATMSARYLTPTDNAAHDIVRCIQSGQDESDPRRLRTDSADFYLRTDEDMRRIFEDIPEALENTHAIAKACTFTVPNQNYIIPDFPAPAGISPADFFVSLSWAGFQKRFGASPPEEVDPVGEVWLPKSAPQKQDAASLETLKKRLTYEIETILSMGFASYFLIVWDLIAYAKTNGVAVGPGRGSAAGSLVSYCLGITSLNPLDHGLLFERFLNPERVSMPDIDIDFADEGLPKIRTYVSEKYGKDHVARICTFGTLAAKAAVKDVGRTLGVSFSDMNQFTARMPTRPGSTLSDAEEDSGLKEAITKEPFQRIWNIARRIEGNIRQIGVHACAVLVADRPITHYTAVQPAPGSADEIITQYSMQPLERIGLLKMDFLGLRNLTILETAIDIIERTHGITLNLETLDLHDAKTYELFSLGRTVGVFQFESSGMRRYLKDLQPSEFQDLVAMVSLFRPGPMEHIPDYIKGKHSPESVVYPHPLLKSFLKETYGVAVYQEQVQRIAQEFAGFSLGQGYLMIKAVAKKIPTLLEEQRSLFIEGATQKGHSKADANRLFKIIEPFAGYGFNKAHAACYSLIAYHTAYIKAHYPAAFMAALLTADRDNPDRLAIDIEEAKMLGVTVAAPDINLSRKHFTVTDDTTVRFGLAGIKGLGEASIESLLSARGNTPFSNLADFAARVPSSALNKRRVEALTFSGALDAFGDRAAIINGHAEISRYAKQSANINAGGAMQESLFDSSLEGARSLTLPKVEPFPTGRKLQEEKNTLGMYLSGHPLSGATEYLNATVGTMKHVTEKAVGSTRRVYGIISRLRVVTTKKTAQKMAFVSIEDSENELELSIFPKVFAALSKPLEEGMFIIASGKVEERGGTLQLIAHEIRQVSLDVILEKAKKPA